MTAQGTDPDRDGSVAIDPRHFRRCLGRFSTGVTVVTYRTAEGERGATMNSFTSVSLDPPLVLLSLARAAQACAAMEGAPFAINVLRADQMDIALQFAGRPNPRLRVPWDTTGAVAEPPALAGTVATLICRPWRRYDGGGHLLQLREGLRGELRGGEPPVFADGRVLSPRPPP